MSHLDNIDKSLTKFYNMFDTFTKSDGVQENFINLHKEFEDFLNDPENNQMVIDIIKSEHDYIKVDNYFWCNFTFH